MKLFVSGATATVRKYADSPYLGRFTQPRCGNNIAEIATCGMDWGGDNNALQGVDPDDVLDMWDAIEKADRSHLKFCAAPDAVMMTSSGPRGDWPATLWLWRCWRPALVRRGLPGAIVAQDGATPSDVPWDEIAALFIGGSTRWKMSQSAALLIRAAAARGRWVHVGRVNSMVRLGHFDQLPVNSFDGGQFSMFPETYIPKYLERLKYQQKGFKHAA